MIGDRLVIYNERTGEFFAGRNDRRIYAYRKSPAIWTKTLNRARLSTNLKALHDICEEVGEGCRVISETRARQIVMLRAREVTDVRRESEQTVLQPTWNLPLLSKKPHHSGI